MKKSIFILALVGSISMALGYDDSAAGLRDEYQCKGQNITASLKGDGENLKIVVQKDDVREIQMYDSWLPTDKNLQELKRQYKDNYLGYVQGGFLLSTGELMNVENNLYKIKVRNVEVFESTYGRQMAGQKIVETEDYLTVRYKVSGSSGGGYIQPDYNHTIYLNKHDNVLRLFIPEFAKNMGSLNCKKVN